MLSRYLQWFSKPSGRRSPRRQPRRLSFEQLEDRCVPSTFSVSTTTDENDAAQQGMPPAGPDGQLSLREAVNAVNADANATAATPDTIDFSGMPSGIQKFGFDTY